MTRREPLLLALLALAAMGAVLLNGVVYDAAAILHADPRFAAGNVDWAGLATRSYWLQGLYRPLTLLLLGVERTLGGADRPWVLHATSLLLYLGVLGLAWRWLRGTRVHPTVVLPVLALFATHPAHVEVVASIVGQAELLVALAMLAAMLVWRDAARHGERWWHVPFLMAMTAAAAFAKEQGFLLPVILLGQQLLLAERLPRRTAAPLLTALALGSITCWLLHWRVTGLAGGETPVRVLIGLAASGRIAVALGIVPEAVRILIAPLHLQAEYGPPGLATATHFGGRAVLGAAILCIALALIAVARTRRPMSAFGLWFAGVTWLPASSLAVPAGLLLGERVLFLPSLGLAIALAGFWPADRPGPRRAVLAVAWALALAGTVRSAIRCRDWRSEPAFYDAMVRDAPRTYRAWYTRGVWLRSGDRWPEAEVALARAWSLSTQDPVVAEEYGQLLRRASRCAEAVPVLEQGLSREPTRTSLRARLFECLLAVGDSVRAREVARDGIALGETGFTSQLRRTGSTLDRREATTVASP